MSKPLKRKLKKVKDIKKPIKMTNECKDCAMGCCGCISLLALVAGSVAYYVFAIIALVNEYHDPFSTMCNCKSHLWVYMLVFIIYTLLFSQKLSNIFQDDKAGYVEKCISFSRMYSLRMSPFF